MRKELRQHRRLRIKKYIRKKIRGTPIRPRLTVYKSLKHFYAQIVDDTTAHTLVSASTLSEDVKNSIKELKSKKEIAQVVGKIIAQKAIEKNINKVVFDRNGYLYHGIVKAFSDGAREGGLQF